MTIFCSSIRKARTIFSLKTAMLKTFLSTSVLSLSPDSLVAQDPTVGPVDGLLASGEASLLLVGGRLDSLQPQASHGALGHRGPLLEVLEHQLTARGPHLLDSIGLGVVRQPSSVRHSLDHFESVELQQQSHKCINHFCSLLYGWFLNSWSCSYQVIRSGTHG